MQKKATRREFLKTGTRIAGTVFLTGLPGACKLASGKTGARPSGIDAKPTPRDGYTIFSHGNIGTMTVKNRLVRSATMVAAANKGRPSQEYIKIHQELAAGGVGVPPKGWF